MFRTSADQPSNRPAARPIRLATLSGLAWGVFALLPMLATTAASAQSWPTRPIRLVVPNPPGGAADALPRMLAEALVSRL